MSRIIALTLLLIASCKTPTHTFVVAVDQLPATLDPRKNDINIYQYINQQLYYPLLEVGSSGRLESKFLNMNDTRVLDQNFSTYRLCLIPQLKFNNGMPILAKHLKTSLEAAFVQKSIRSVRSVQAIDDRCVELAFNRRMPLLLEQLTTVNSTVLESEEFASYPNGYGPYVVQKFDATDLMLTAQKINGNVNLVHFKKVTANATDEELRAIDELNLITSFKVSKSSVQSHQKFRRLSNKVAFLLVRYNDPVRRKAIFNCLNSEAVLKEIDVESVRSGSFLPQNISSNVLKSTESLSRDCRQETFRWVDYNEDRAVQLEKAVQNLKMNHVSVQKKDLDWVLKAIEGSQEEFVLIGSASGTTEGPEVFFELFKKDRKMLFSTLGNVDKLFSSAYQKADALNRDLMLAEAERSLLESGYVIPLGQSIQTKYYPRHIKIVAWFDHSTAFPDISRIQYGEQ